MSDKKITAIDVCAGAGGWAVAARGLPIEIIAAFDREEDCLATYKLNHPRTECIRCDVMTQDFSVWRGIDLVLGGIPCETLSVARNNRRAKKPELKMFTALLNRFLSLPGELGAAWYWFEEIIQVIPMLPPGTPFVKLSSESYSAQKRMRVYIGNAPAPIPGDNRQILADHLLPGPYRLSPRIHGKRQPSRAGKHSSTFQPFPADQKSFTVTNFVDSRRDARALLNPPKPAPRPPAKPMAVREDPVKAAAAFEEFKRKRQELAAQSAKTT